ncbi:ferritin-like domain-containing protein [Sporolactobacillus sp. CQH2019]|uniref:ferritin-like domain-containing protein n=1 Tax=Sporolactobacillus sp. CQH2019 TaxID=3023512 RepID=UPI0023676BE8|nr:ferritin-like domain-containing protein [Sporolactobacillus sp. CQH2019]MDD9149594.1 ferritin-like domain-containing protein [Sporolactobacillus sp. CQH2019]
MSIDKLYEAEVAQSEKDHHTPTAGAMSGHILANLKIHQVKMAQAVYYARGTETAFLRKFFSQAIQEEFELFDELAQLLLDESEVIPTTTGEFSRYSMLEEQGKFKYLSAREWLVTAVKDFDTQNLFITRAIKLAAKEDKLAIQAFLVRHLSWNHRKIRELQAFLDHTPREGLDEEGDN